MFLKYFVLLVFILSPFIAEARGNRSSGYKSYSHKSYSRSYKNPYNSSSVRVRGYYRKNGAYVKPHYRTRADGTKSNNWSHKGNVNPYTGKKGTKD